MDGGDQVPVPGRLRPRARARPATHVYLDFWPVAHVWLGWALLARPRYTFALALAVAVLEIVIVVTKFVLFLGEPQWTIWTTNWFVNKLFVLGCFVLMLGHLLARRREYAPRPAPDRSGEAVRRLE